MIFVQFKNGLPVAVSTVVPKYLPNGGYDYSWESRNDWKSYAQVCGIAKYLTAITGKVYLGCDQGEGCYPRYDVVLVPSVGDAVSYGFNGDYYPDGVVTKVTKKFQVTTSGGRKYRRRKNTGSWTTTCGTWSLINGHINERNPSF